MNGGNDTYETKRQKQNIETKRDLHESGSNLEHQHTPHNQRLSKIGELEIDAGEKGAKMADRDCGFTKRDSVFSPDALKSCDTKPLEEDNASMGGLHQSLPFVVSNRISSIQQLNIA